MTNVNPHTHRRMPLMPCTSSWGFTKEQVASYVNRDKTKTRFVTLPSPPPDKIFTRDNFHEAPQHSEPWIKVRSEVDLLITGSPLGNLLGCFHSVTGTFLKMKPILLVESGIDEYWDKLRFNLHYKTPQGLIFDRIPTDDYPEFDLLSNVFASGGTDHEDNITIFLAEIDPDIILEERGMKFIDDNMGNHKNFFTRETFTRKNMGFDCSASDDILIHNPKPEPIHFSKVSPLLDSRGMTLENGEYKFPTTHMPRDRDPRDVNPYSVFKNYEYRDQYRVPYKYVPPYYYSQIQWQMFIDRTSMCRFVSYTISGGVMIYRIPRNDVFISLMLSLLWFVIQKYINPADGKHASVPINYFTSTTDSMNGVSVRAVHKQLIQIIYDNCVDKNKMITGKFYGKDIVIPQLISCFNFLNPALPLPPTYKTLSMPNFPPCFPPYARCFVFRVAFCHETDCNGQMADIVTTPYEIAKRRRNLASLLQYVPILRFMAPILHGVSDFLKEEVEAAMKLIDADHASDIQVATRLFDMDELVRQERLMEIACDLLYRIRFPMNNEYVFGPSDEYTFDSSLRSDEFSKEETATMTDALQMRWGAAQMKLVSVIPEKAVVVKRVKLDESFCPEDDPDYPTCRETNMANKVFDMVRDILGDDPAYMESIDSLSGKSGFYKLFASVVMGTIVRNRVDELAKLQKKRDMRENK